MYASRVEIKGELARVLRDRDLVLVQSLAYLGQGDLAVLDLLRFEDGITVETLVFTEGGLSTKLRIITEGKDAAWMANHIARKRLTEGLTPLLSQCARVGYISTWDSHKAPQPDCGFGGPGRDGMGHVLKPYVPDYALFARLSQMRPDFHVLEYNPGPTKGTSFAELPDTPLIRLLVPLLKLMPRPIDQVSAEFLQLLDKATPGISWINAGEPITRTQHMDS